MFKPGDKVALRADVLQRHARSVPAHMGYTPSQFRWRDALRLLAGCVGTVSSIENEEATVHFAEAPAGKNINYIGIKATELVALPG